MDSKRQHKFSRLIQKDLGEIFQQNSVSMFGGSFITVTHVEISPDLGLAKVYLSFLLVKDPESKVAEIEEQSKAIRNILGQRIRHQARVIPQLRFYYDNTAEEAEKIEDLFKDIDIPDDKGDNDDDTYTR
ncbi:30S ribosome-binding factor RbfA [Flammeovirga kamogawensis]|uniref:Ribosome-binding factor A n=1 Tax=Flammeovirga kamogawensis TaxID=373891 RepID=A0ABX8GWW1_9BACT|nr:30S ribosome-binding factor RbfA [Flammeovirga kamogawensis]MBB6461042.1 ribosome-binding factor A [Flammeovirga kamogawensis]QWG07612.1 30S ribosome-binding factor RbfA [Flammeovirga kamogawensis]TRX69423.1 30S ribosome-binding factor RbfA [Flammeovirga kamogawensis]